MISPPFQFPICKLSPHARFPVQFHRVEVCFYCGEKTRLRICGVLVCCECSDLLDAGQKPPKISKPLLSDCNVCAGALWVCEDHQDKPWAGASHVDNPCECGAPGVPCLCNPADHDHPPKMPEGYRTIFGKDGWVN